ncbi:NUMOD4 motif-containing HNH endonuclease [Streptomyces sp. NBC_00878]|uniref:NUMOD4 motif-containing HNH endonuclease n=1 Tax=Streptomyces sp. NBC_00878 TaxID=2975854 RepID=UPI0022552A1D|nr:NUMOD4 motif-containing HNH endonuclease [Streptomyces sp. NBC_00878]MCX4911856.1 NUMOD4 motif-containing HNH endonuclease [Streptomyces sp. NBC_00878]
MTPTQVEWRPIAEFPYEVSNHGRVRRSTGGSNCTKPGRVLKGSVDRYGYIVVRLSRNGQVHDRKVHRLVCEAFHGPSELQVRHLDGNRSNNTVANLLWGTAGENAADRDLHGTHRRGERSPRAKLTNRQVAQIRREHARARVGRQRVPRGWLPVVADHYGLTIHGLATILYHNGYADQGAAQP